MSRSRTYLSNLTDTYHWTSWVFFLLIPLIVYLFFADVQTRTIYGDDLYVFKTYAESGNVASKLNQPLIYGKYRPVHGVSIFLLIETLEKNIAGYYMFNVLVQSLNTILLALTINLFFRNILLSLLLSLVTGLSSFGLFNMTQLFNGGALEGLAITFFLATLYYLVKCLYATNSTPQQVFRRMVYAIILANLAMYTHERYVVLLPFLFLVICLSPVLRTLKVRPLMILLACTILSVLLNVFIKEYIYGMPFLMGTASTQIQFSLSTALGFLGDALLSLIRWNAGPDFLIGTRFSTLSFLNRTLIVLVAGFFFFLLVRYILRIRGIAGNRSESRTVPLLNLSFLIILGGLVLLPAVSTIRLEQRWLQAPFSLFILIFSIVLSEFLRQKQMVIRIGVVLAISLIYIRTEYNYLRFGREVYYLLEAEKIAESFKKSIDNNTIHPESEKLYIWQPKKDINAISSILWSIGDGSLFDFYLGNRKAVAFVDSLYERSQPTADSVHFNFKPGRDQLLYLKPDHSHGIFDITGSYLVDSLRDFNPLALEQAVALTGLYSMAKLTITNKDTDKFLITGLHSDENGASWTTGDVSFGLRGDFIVQDSVQILLNTYLPPACKNILPELWVEDKLQRKIKALQTQRSGDSFMYTFRFDKPTFVKEIRILADTIQATPPDTRKLSFPFISLEIKR